VGIVWGWGETWQYNFEFFAWCNLWDNSKEISIYVGDLDPSVTEAKMYEYFRGKYSSVFAAKIITCNTTKVSKGYGFVKFTNPDEAQRAIAENNGVVLLGKPMKVSHAYMKTKEDPREEEEDSTTKAGQMIKVYQQFYAMMNDPILKAAY
jgi:RNA recognition motif-containing protein